MGTFGNWVHNLFVLKLFGAAFRLSSKQKVSNCRHFKIDNIDPLSNFIYYSDSYFTLLSSLRWHSALSSEGQIIFGCIWRLSPQLTCSQSTTYLFSINLEQHSASAPNRKYPIADTWKLIILTPCQIFSLFQFLFYSIVPSEGAFWLILRRTNNIWVHLETKSTTYLFSIYLEWHSAWAPNRKYPIADTWKLIILTPSQFLFTIPILILLYCPLWGGIPPYPQKDK